MARYRGPKSKIARKFGEAIFGDDKSFEKKNYPPGHHGNARRRGKKSEYAIQLMEKQKAKYTYGILERQFRNLFAEANRSKGVTGEVLLQLCESRLDNVVYRMGISPSRRGARQLVSHRHITVNGNVVNIPSYSLRAGDVLVYGRNPNPSPVSPKQWSLIAQSMSGSTGTMTVWRVHSFPYRNEFRSRRISRNN